jgi:DNA repair protein RadD
MLRSFQRQMVSDVYAAWATGARNVMLVSPTGSGKTVMFGHITKELDAPACLISHRQELVGQAALALNREEIPHAIIAPKPIQQQIITLEHELHGRSFYSPRAPARVAGVDTLINHEADSWMRQVQLVIQDEGHHVLRDNKWGSAMAFFPSARGLFPTAHALRADGKGLGRGADGLVDSLVVGPSCRELIDRGYLADYRLIAPPSDIHVEDIELTASGDFSPVKLRAAVHKSKTIVGDVVGHYLKFAAGKLGITFAVDIEAAQEIAAGYRAQGVGAEIITAKTPLSVRGQLMKQFRARQILQLVSVDVLGEGVDVPAVEVVSMARPTQSFQLYSQQFGRALRLMLTESQTVNWDNFTVQERLNLIAASVKPKAIIIDHVQNYIRHGLPDVSRSYTLNRQQRRKRTQVDDAIPLRACVNPECLQPYEAVLTQCPHCGHIPIPRRRSTPEEVDGDLSEIDPATLAEMRGAVSRVDTPPVVNRADIVGASILKNHRLRRDAQHELRKAMSLWGGWQKHLGRDEREAQRRFFYQFGRDVLTAQALNTADATELMERIAAHLSVNNIVEAA